MSTNSSISIKLNDGRFQTQYCHWDGYLLNNGVKLYEYFNNREKVKLLLSYGDMSSLGNSIETCDFYHRDMREELSINIEDDIYEYDFNYVFIDDEWYLYDYSRWDDITDEEYHYDIIKLVDVLVYEIPEYKKKIRIKKLERIIDEKETH